MVYIKLILTTFFWGGTFIAGRQIAGVVDPYSAAFLRFLIASIFLVFLTRYTQGSLPRINNGQALRIFLLGLTGVFSYNIFFFTGLSMINANRASLIIATNPIFISFFSVLVLREKLSTSKICGLFLSVAGALIVLSNGNLLSIFKTGIGKGELAIFACVFSWVAYSIIGAPLMKSLSPMASVCYSSIAGTLLLVLPIIARGGFQNLAAYPPSAWASLFYLGFFGTVLGFFWYYQGIHAIGPVKAGVFINFVPISALVLAYLILDEPLTAVIICGAALVITGVAITNLSKTRSNQKKL